METILDLKNFFIIEGSFPVYNSDDFKNLRLILLTIANYTRQADYITISTLEATLPISYQKLREYLDYLETLFFIHQWDYNQYTLSYYGIRILDILMDVAKFSLAVQNYKDNDFEDLIIFSRKIQTYVKY